MTEFLRLNDVNIDNAYEIIRWRFDYLMKKGIKQYLAPYPPFDTFKKRQEDGLNFGLYISGKLNGIVTLMNSFPEEWEEIKLKDRFLWICSLFTSKEAKGKNVGSVLIEKIEEYAKSISVDLLILDCYINETDFLVKYYQKFGFKEIKRKEVIYPSRSFFAAFMLKDIKIK
jgi:GNAT superfamily N-acetyltransferase